MDRHEKRQSTTEPAVHGGGGMPRPGDIIADKYRVEAVLGRGGMSVVYRATHLQLEQQVAIKVLSAEALMMPEYVVRLKREARAISRVRSEHVVRVHDIGELTPGGVPFLVMECLRGADLAALLTRRGPLPVEMAVECIMQACEALAEAHAIGIVHRDLKPANLFLTEAVDGSPCLKVLDFGISRMARGPGLAALTDPGTVLGTPRYMAPEQMEAATVDARADIWALGTILYELLVGKPPYHGETLPKIFVKIMQATSAPKPSASRPDVPREIDAIVARCLEVDEEDRFQTVAELGWALSEIGTPHARDAAERISRVFDRYSEGAVSSGTLRSSVLSSEPPAVSPVDGVARRRARRRKAWASRLHSGNFIAACASIALVAGTLAFGVTEIRSTKATAPANAAALVEVGAVGIGPMVRRNAEALADGSSGDVDCPTDYVENAKVRDARLATNDVKRGAPLAAVHTTSAAATRALVALSLEGPAVKADSEVAEVAKIEGSAALAEPAMVDGGAPPPETSAE